MSDNWIYEFDNYLSEKERALDFKRSAKVYSDKKCIMRGCDSGAAIGTGWYASSTKAILCVDHYFTAKIYINPESGITLDPNIFRECSYLGCGLPMHFEENNDEQTERIMCKKHLSIPAKRGL